MEFDRWQHLRVAQILMVDDTAVLAKAQAATDDRTEHDGESRTAETEALSPIPEVSEEDTDLSSMPESLGSYLQHEDPALQEVLKNTSVDSEHSKAEEDEVDQQTYDRMPLELWTVSPENITLAPPQQATPQEMVELAIYPPMTNTVPLEQQPAPNEIELLL